MYYTISLQSHCCFLTAAHDNDVVITKKKCCHKAFRKFLHFSIYTWASLRARMRIKSVFTFEKKKDWLIVIKLYVTPVKHTSRSLSWFNMLADKFRLRANRPLVHPFILDRGKDLSIVHTLEIWWSKFKC